jgi:hypothetical protein
MFIIIPTGLIRSLVGEAVGAPEWYVRGERPPDADQIAAQHTASMVDSRAREVLWACTGPDACLVVLGDNDWNNCWFDGVRLAADGVAAPAAPQGGYRSAAQEFGPGPHGLAAVCAGRHVITTDVGGKRAVLHLTLHPQEACFFRLDGSGAFCQYEPSQEQALVARLNELSFVSYAETVARRRIAGMLAKSAAEATNECLRELQGLLPAVVARDAKTVQERTARAVDAIVGAPLASFERITTFVGFHAFDLLGKNKGEEAWSLVSAGLRVLPENPTLLGISGELLLRAGDRERGVQDLQKALAREAGMDAKLRDRVRGLLASA